MTTDTTSFQISLPQMIDLALKSPEIGAINFTVLHNFLHVLVHLTGLNSEKVEYRGENAERMKSVLSSVPMREPSIQLHACALSKKNSDREEHPRLGHPSPHCDDKINGHVDVSSTSSQSQTEVIISTEPSTTNQTETALSNGNMPDNDSEAEKLKPMKLKEIEEKNNEIESIILVQPSSATKTSDVLLDVSSFKKLDESIQNLNQKFHVLQEGLTRNSEMIEKMEAKNVDSVTEMWHAINSRRRSDASKQSIEKLTTEDREFTKSDKPKREAGGADLVDRVVETNKITEVEDDASSRQNDANSTLEQSLKKEQSCASGVNIKQDQSFDDTLHATQSSPNAKVSSTLTADNLCNIPSELDVLGEVDCCKLRTDVMKMTCTLTQLKGEICGLKEKLYEVNKAQHLKGDKEKDRYETKCAIMAPEGESQDKYFVIKQKEADPKPTKCTDLICKVEKSLIKGIQCIENRIESFEDYVNCSLRNINDIVSQNKSEEELIRFVQAVRIDLEDTRRDVCELQHARCEQEQQNDVFQEQIEVLKSVKANKDEVEEALSEKADICELNKKVSHEQFDAVCDGLARGLDEAFTKISQQESILQQTVVELRNEIEGKLDELEIPAFKDFVHKELHAIKNQLRVLNEMKQSQDAAGARKIRDLRCISCNNDASIKTNAKLTVGSYAFPCRASMAPHRAFKMDEIRKQNINASQGKDLINLEKIMNENGITKPQCPGTNEKEDNFCSRYCGGSHTVISPQQKVAKPKNCVTQWTVQDLQMVEGFVEGTDRKMYRGKWFAGQNPDQPTGKEKPGH